MSAGVECPLCKQNGHRRKLRKFFINFQESIVLCNYSKCTYPLGCDNTDKLISAARGQNSDKSEVHNGDLVNIDCGLSSENGDCNGADPNLKVLQPLSELHVRPQERIVSAKLNTDCDRSSENGDCIGADPHVKVLQPLNDLHVRSQEQILCAQKKNPLSAMAPQKVESPQPTGVCSLPIVCSQQTDVCSNKSSVFPTTMPLADVVCTKLLCPERQMLCPRVLENRPVLNPPKICITKCTVPQTVVALVEKSSQSGKAVTCVSGSPRSNVSHKLFLSGLKPLYSKTTPGKTESSRGEERPVKCPIDRWFLQWENRDALCWLDVVLCLLVQSQSIRKAIEIKKSNPNESKKGFLVRTLLSAYDQALALSKSLLIECRRRLQSERKHKAILSEQRAPCQPIVCMKEIHTPGQSAKSVDNYNEKLLCGRKGVPLKMGAGQTDCPIIQTRTSMAELVVRNADFCKARSILNTVRELMWEELQPKLRCEKGRKDSPVFAIPLLLHSDPDICHLFETTYKFETNCNQCGNNKIERYTKVLPTLPKVVAEFSMSNICHLRDCFTCKAPNQKRQLHFESLADCVMIHFVEGLPSSDLSSLNFSLDGESFHVSAVVQYKNDPSHFVIWIQHSSGDSWMECDDLKGPLCKFSQSCPCLPASEIHIVFWERDANTAKNKDRSRYESLVELTVDKKGSREITPNRQRTSIKALDPLVVNITESIKSVEMDPPTPEKIKAEYRPKSSVLKKNYLLLKQMKAKQFDLSKSSINCVNSMAVENKGKSSVKCVNSMALGNVGKSSILLETKFIQNSASAERINKEGRELLPSKLRQQINKDGRETVTSKLKQQTSAQKFEGYKSKKDANGRMRMDISAQLVSLRSNPHTPTDPQSASQPWQPGKRKKSITSWHNNKRLHTAAEPDAVRNSVLSSVPGGENNRHSGNIRGDNTNTSCNTTLPVNPVIPSSSNSLDIDWDDILDNTDVSMPAPVIRGDNSEDLTTSLFTDIDLTDLGFCNIGTGLSEGKVNNCSNSGSSNPRTEDNTRDSALCEADILQDLYKALDITAPASSDTHLLEEIFT